MKRFTLTEAHLNLLSEMCVGWCDDEYGAPEIDPKRPYGNSDVEGDVRKILDDPEMTDEQVREIHDETKTALQVCLRTQTFSTGIYECDDYRNNWMRVSSLEHE